MSRTSLYIIGALALMIGGFLLGWGIGKIFFKDREGMLIGLGAGITIIGLVSFSTYRRLLAFNRETT